MKSKSVTILGNGVVGIQLGRGFVALGYDVVFASRDPDNDKSRAALALVSGSRALQPRDAIATTPEDGIIAVALPWSAVGTTLSSLSPDPFAGRIVIDASNPLDFSQGSPRLALGFSDSAGETVQRLLPHSLVVKAFNTIGAGLFVQPHFTDGVPDMFIAGNNAEAKSEVDAIVRGFGWRKSIDAGDISASRLLEPLAMLWIDYGFRHDHWTHGFSLLGRE